MAGWDLDKLPPPRCRRAHRIDIKAGLRDNAVGAEEAPLPNGAGQPHPGPAGTARGPATPAATALQEEEGQPAPPRSQGGEPLEGPHLLKDLEREVSDLLAEGAAQLQEAEDAAERILRTLTEMVADAGLVGEVKAFGSFLNGFRRGASDLDISFVSVADDQSDPVLVLSRLLPRLPEVFNNVTKVFLATTPLIKFTDRGSGLEVDFCVNNRLGVRNTMLLSTYCKFDQRVQQLGRLVKDWAKAHGLVGTPDGYLNSYAYMLLVIHYLQQCSPPVVPNLQMLARESVLVTDRKWGSPETWDTKFVEDVGALPPSENGRGLGDLLAGFFNFYGHEFNWNQHAVSIRLNQERVFVEKASLSTQKYPEHWYVEDPFDLRHNLAGKCTGAARWRILDKMRAAYEALTAGRGWSLTCPAWSGSGFYIRCRVTHSVRPQMLLAEFDNFGLVRLHFPRLHGRARSGQAFLEFPSAAARRSAHTRNEAYVADCQVLMLDSSLDQLEEARGYGVYTTYEVGGRNGKAEELRSAEDSWEGAGLNAFQ